jgi:hypothetical protein
VQNSGPKFHLNWTQARTGRDTTPAVSLSRDIMLGNTHLSIP